MSEQVLMFLVTRALRQCMRTQSLRRTLKTGQRSICAQPGFLNPSFNLSTLTFWTWSFSFIGDCPLHWRRFSSLSGFYSLDANSTWFHLQLKAMATQSGTLAWRIPWMEEPGGLQSRGHEETDTTEQLHFHFSLPCTGEGNGNPLQYSCLENPRDGEPGGLPSIGSHRVGHDWSDLAAAAFLMAQLVKSPPAMWETWVWSLGWRDPLEKGTATHSSILAWRIPWTVYRPKGCKESDTTDRLSHSHTHFCLYEKTGARKKQFKVNLPKVGITVLQ